MTANIDLVYGHRHAASSAALLLVLEPGEIGLDTSTNTLWMRDYSSNYFPITQEIFSVQAYGAKGDGIADDTTAIIAAGTALQAAGGGELLFPPGNYLTHTGGLTTTLAAFSGLVGVTIRLVGATITCNRSFTSGQGLNYFTFTNCKLIRVIEWNHVSPTYLASAVDRQNRGVSCFTFYQGCEGIHFAGNYRQIGGQIGVAFNRASTDPLSYKSKNIVIDNMWTYATGYPVTCQFSGDNLRAKIEATYPFRAFFIYGVKHIHAMVRSRNNAGDDLDITGYESGGVDGGCEDVHVWYTNNDSTAAESAAPGVVVVFNRDTGSTGVNTGTAQAGGASTITLAAGASAVNNLYNAVTITGGTGAGQYRTLSGYVGSTKVATTNTPWTTPPDNTSVYSAYSLAGVFHRNINIHLDVVFPAAGYPGDAFQLYKITAPGVYDTLDRGYVLDGLRISGTVKGSANSPFGGGGTWGTGDFVRNFSLRDFTGISTVSGNLAFLASVDGIAEIENVTIPNSLFLGANASGSKIVCVACKVTAFTGSTADAGYHDYIDCVLTDGTNQSITNKRFQNTLVSGLVQPNAQEQIGARSAATSLAKLFLDDAAGSSPVTSDNMAIDIRTSAGIGALARNIAMFLAQCNHATNFADFQLIFGSSNSAANQLIAMAILQDGSMSFRKRASTGTSLAANTLLPTEMANLTDLLLDLKTAGLKLGGGFQDKTLAVTGDLTLSSIHSTLLCDATSASFILTLPAAASHTGRIYSILKVDASANTVTVGATVLCGNTGVSVLRIQSDGTNWKVLELYEEGTFTATLTGCTTSPTSAVKWTRTGDKVAMYIPGVQGTSNSTACTLTGLPTTLQPATNHYLMASEILDASTPYTGLLKFGATGTITLFIKTAANASYGSTFTNSATAKGLSNQADIEYLLV